MEEQTRRLLLFCRSEIIFHPKCGREIEDGKNRNILLYGAGCGEENEKKNRNILLYRGGKKKFKKQFYYIRRRRWRVTRRRSVRDACAGRWEVKQRLRGERRRLGRNARFWAGAHARAETKATGPGEGKELANGNGRNGGTNGGTPPPPPRIFVQTRFRTGGGGGAAFIRQPPPTEGGPHGGGNGGGSGGNFGGDGGGGGRGGGGRTRFDRRRRRRRELGQLAVSVPPALNGG